MPRSAGGSSAGPPDLADLLRGLYERVARQLNLDPYYVSRVARGELPSKTVEDALRRELVRIKALTERGRRVPGGATRKNSASTKTKKKRARNKKRLQLLTFKSPRDPSR
jgi:hypothetical protein